MLEITYRNQAERALVAILQRAPNRGDLYALVGDALLWQAAQENRVAPIVAHHLVDALGPGNVPGHWRQVHEEAHRRISAYLAELDRVAARLAEEGVTVVLVENAALARAVHPCPGCFEFGDLDLLIRKEQLPAVRRVLVADGYTVRTAGSPSRRGELDLSGGRVEYERVLSAGRSLRLNVQWSLVARRWFDARREPDLEVLLRRSIPIPGSPARMLCPEDNLFQLAKHNASHAYVHSPGIRLHLDIERFVRRVPVEWPRFLDRVEQFRVKTAVYFSLAIPRALFATPVPDSVLRDLCPPRWKERLVARWLDRAGLFHPAGKKFGRVGYIIFTALLYDDLGGLWRAIFPGRAWMRQRYGFRCSAMLPFYHARRLAGLVFHREGT